MDSVAKEKYEEFIKSNFNINDDKISHKLEHTLYVIENSEYLCNELKLNKETKEIAKIIALLHDFGRFYEAKELKSFREDLTNMDHASLGVKLLFKDNLIRKFIKIDKYDKIIKTAIANHSKYILDTSKMTKEEILHSKIIRDADKLDSFRAKTYENIYTMSNITEEDIENSLISKNIYNDFMNERTILSKDRKTPLDIWISYIAFIYDLNFIESLKYIKSKNYINMLVNRFKYKNNKSIKEMEEIRNKANSYINTKMEVSDGK